MSQSLLDYFARHNPSANRSADSGLAADEWEDEDGRIWNVKVRDRPDATPIAANTPNAPLQPPADPPGGDLASEKPTNRLVVRPDASRYDKAFVKARNARADFKEALELYGPADPRTVALADITRKSEDAFEKVRKQANTDNGRRWMAIDANRKTPDGREDYNNKRRPKRRKVRSAPNRDLSHLTPEQKREEKKQRDRERIAKQRAEAKAKKLAAENA